MECNKDEAAKAKEIAEKKFLTKDLPGAKRFALKAQNLYPGLEGIPQMVATLDVYISAENKKCGELDWYGILGVDPQADDEAVKKQYRKLALILHPDKNKSVGADGAFKFISEAWSLLSDKSKRAAYDQKMRTFKLPAKCSNPAGSSSKMPASAGSFSFTKPSAKPPKSTPRTNQSSNPVSSQKSKPNTFWTVCYRCKMQYEYLRVYLNHNLLCPNCHEPFLAVETAPPHSDSSKSSTTWNFSQQRHNINNHQATNKNSSSYRVKNVNPPSSESAGFSGPVSSGQTNFQWSPFSRAGSASSVAQAANVVQQAYEKVKRDREEAQAAIKREEALKRKNYVFRKMAGMDSGGAKRRRNVEDIGLGNNGSNVTNQTVPGGDARNHDFSGIVRVNAITRPVDNREASQVGLQTMLMEKAKGEISHKITEWNTSNASKTSVNNGMSNNETHVGEKSQVTVDISDQNKYAEYGKFTTSGATEDVETLETLSIDVPDPDFHNFDKDRTETCFGENEVWAAYDGADGMPRFYALIHNVISLNPFKMKISWLNSRSNSELGPINWIGSGFTKTCGEFWVGKYETYDSLNSFSHKVKWTKGARGVICIYPKKGDVWALYRNWSPEWNQLTASEVVHKYDMVEVLEDYDDTEGVTVAPLVKVAGFKTVFHRHLDPSEIRSIRTEEMFRFSHIVPSYLLTGQEGANAPKGCRELDPAATPLDLLHVIVDAKDEDSLYNNVELKEEKR